MKRFISFIVAAMLLVSAGVQAKYSDDDLIDTLNSAIKWKENEASPSYDAGSAASDLYITALSRMGMEYDYAKYYDNLRIVIGAYGSNSSAYSYAHTILAMQACDADAQYTNGRDYVAEGTYYKGNISGADNWSWGLIALDSGGYDVPDWAYDTRDDMVKYIMANRNEDGSIGTGAEQTALAIIALADYTYDDTVYTYVNDATGKDESMIVMQAVSEALDYLSDAQSDWGDYYDLRSTALTLIALDYMDIDAETDKRFIKDGNTVIDGLMVYREGDGGFSNEMDGSDSLSTSYAICALTSHLRYVQNRGKLFDFLSNDSVDGIKQIQTSGDSSNNTNDSSGNSTSSSSSNSGTSNSSSSSSSSSNDSSSSSSSSSTATSKPTISSTATSKPVTTMSPVTSSKPKVASTTRPASTARPSSSANPKSSASPTTAPSKKAFVGPLEMPGPMMETPEPTISPSGEPETAASGRSGGGIKHSLPIGIALLAIAALIAAACVTYVIYTGKDFELLNKSKRVNNDKYKAKIHRRTEIHGRYKLMRGRYKERGKYKNSKRRGKYSGTSRMQRGKYKGSRRR